jgi:hypothetical protein
MDRLVLLKVALLILNPILISLVVYVVGGTLFWAINRRSNASSLRSIWRKTLAAIGIMAVLSAAIDTAFAYRRVQYGRQIPKEPVVVKTVPTPSAVVLIDIRCEQKCLERLVAGTHTEVIYVSTLKSENNTPVPIAPPYPAVRYTIVRTAPNACPADSRLEIERTWTTPTILALSSRGICPKIESVEAPSEGIFIVNEAKRVSVKAAAVELPLRLVTAKLPGPVSYFNATEVQRRTQSGIELLGRVQAYEAPGFLGFPPLLGCWERPDNIVFILPPGEPGCGLWRLTTQGGDQTGRFFNGEWIYARVFQ